MIAYLAGLSSVYAAIYIWAVAARVPWFRAESESDLLLAIVMIAIPAAAAWIVGEAAVLIRRPRLFDHRLRLTPARFALGVLAGMLALVVGASLLPALDERAGQSAILGATAALVTLGAILPLPRHRRGHCIYCTYDLRSAPAPGQPGAGLCPECGRAVSI